MAHSKITLEQYIGFRKKHAVKEKKKVNVGKVISFIFLALFCIIWISPFVLLFFGSLRGITDTIQYPREIFYPHSGYSLENFEFILFASL